MNIPMSWLKAYVDIDVSVEDFTGDITMSGSKVEMVEYVNKDIKNVVVGKILSIEKHPDADKLVVCQIDIGKKILQIVTGAKNVEPGQFVPVAVDGAVLAKGVTIKNSKLRGVESEGMLCSIEELGYTHTDYPESPEDGIYIFQKEYPLGADALEILEIKEEVVEFEITNNRPDCYSVMGIAREAAATYNKKLKFPEIKLEEKAEGKACDYVKIEIEDSHLCPRYIARVVKNVKIEPSPQWMRHRLITSGIRPINNIVDITNYVMLELGQPLHAFDIEGVKDAHIIVRKARENEKITTLDGVERNLDRDMLVISDTEKAIAVAGVMGGENSKVKGCSAAILFESANFNGTNVRLTSKRLGLRTDASGKYEKNLDPNLSFDAVNRCVQLVEMLGAGEVVKGMVDCYPNVRKSKEVAFDENRINSLLGVNLEKSQMDEILSRLGVVVKDNIALIPTFRPDLESEADIAEEIARIYGYNNIETTLAAGTPTVGKRTNKQIIEDSVKNTMAALGFNESMNYAFESPKVFDKLDLPEDSPLRQAVRINNPLGEDFSIMRTVTVNGLLTSLATNYNRRTEEALLFEVGKKYLPKSLPLTELPCEKETLTIAFYSKDEKKDYFYLKGIIEALLEAFAIRENTDFIREAGISFMHPGRCAGMTFKGKSLGYLGEVHPLVCDNYDIGAKAYIASIDLDLVYENAILVKEYKALPKYPAVTRDIAMLVKDEIAAGDIEKIIKESGGNILESVKLFDVYKGSQIKEGHKSVAYAISFRATDRTLTDEDVSKKMEKIVKGLENKLEAALRL